MSEAQTSQAPSGNGSAPPAATTQRKPRSLADLVEEQVKGGLLDPSELEKPVQWKSNFGSRGGGEGFGSAGGRRWNNPDRGDSNGGYQRQYKDNSSLNWQQKELLGNNRDGGENPRQGGYNNNRRPSGPTRGGPNQGPRSDRGQWMKQQGRGKSAGDLPEWATDLDTSVQDNSGLNWQQKSLLSRDESNPFNRLVRGEDEYNHE